jgi:tetratricopeptide (TPR) repeat protein
MNRHERRAAAHHDSKASKPGRASDAAAFYQAGLKHQQAGRYLDAQVSCEQALSADPNHVDALHLMGLLALQARQFDHAIEWIARANAQDPSTDYLYSVGLALAQQGLHGEAFKAFDGAVQLKPGDIEFRLSHGKALEQLGRLTEALSSYHEVLKLDPRHAGAAYACGFLLLHHLGRAEEALAYFSLCEQIAPNHAGALEQRGQALLGLKRPAQALLDSQRAHALSPDNPDTSNNIGAALQMLGRDKEALPWFEKAIGLRANFPTALANRALTLTQLQCFDEAFAAFDQVRRLAPDDAEAELNLAQLQFLTGDFERGLAGREARWRTAMRPANYPPFSQPMWRGEESVEGKTILVYEDEGFGDSIQFARYLPLLAARGARVILVVGDALVTLLSQLTCVAQCLPKSQASWPAFDMHCPLCTLPLAFGTRLDTIPSAPSYLAAPPARAQAWEEALQTDLGPRNRLRVGLAWSGRPTHVNDHNRSIPLRSFAPLLGANAIFISLQKDPRPDDKAQLTKSRIINVGDHLPNFTETAALMSCLDLVITVDTSIAHLAGALGRPTWLLLPFTPDHRWLLQRDDSAWYPSLRLFRQGEARDWAEVMARVQGELAARIAAR